MSDGTTPRPWFHVGRPWVDGPGLIYSGSEDPHVGNMVADTESSLNPDADAALIVEAVNAYDRLRRIETAARALVSSRDGHLTMTVHDHSICEPIASDLLRAALDEPTP
jgi:hypothetical protein